LLSKILYLWLRLAEAFPFTYIPWRRRCNPPPSCGISRIRSRLRQGVLAVLAAFDRRSSQPANSIEPHATKPMR
jgi:hypothetical protein